MVEEIRSKPLLTTKGQKRTKKYFILEYYKNRPTSALEVANRIHTSPGYVYKVRSQARKPSKDIRGRNGRIFAHGKVYYQWHVMAGSVAKLNAPVINQRTGMKQIGFIEKGDLCSCQIHPNGHLIVWPHSIGWQEWLVKQLAILGWTQELSRYIVDSLMVNVTVAECGVKPLDPCTLPKELSIKTLWGVAVVRDDTPEKGVLELKLSVPDLTRYLGLPEIKKTLDVIEQGALTHNQSHKTIEGLLISLYRVLQEQGKVPSDEKGGHSNP